MAISEVGTYQCLNPGSVTPQFQIPTTALAGDLCIVYIAGTAPATAPAAWTQWGADSALTQTIWAYWVTMADPGQVVTFGTTNYADGAMVVLRGVPPLGAFSIPDNNFAVGLAAPAISSSVMGDWYLAFWWTRGSTSGSTCTLTVPGAMVSDGAYGGSSPSSGPPVNAIAVGHFVYPSAESFGPETATASYSSGGALSSGAFSVYIPVAAPPATPTPTTPASGSYVDAAANGVTFAWNPVPGQTGYAIQRTLTGFTPQYWNGSSWTTSSGYVFQPGTANAIFTPASGWADGNTYTWIIAVQTAGGSSGPCAAQTLNTEASAVVMVSAPTGTQTTTTPTVTLSGSFPSGLSLVQYRVVIYTSAQYGAGGFSPGVSAAYCDSGYLPTPGGSGPWNYVTPPITTGTGTFRAYVQIYDGHQYSSWAYSQFVENVTLPNTPTCVNTPNASTGSIGVQIANPSGGVTVNHNDIYRRVTSVGGNGERVATGLAVNALWTDYSPATGVDYEYQVLAVAASGVAGVGAWTD